VVGLSEILVAMFLTLYSSQYLFAKIIFKNLLENGDNKKQVYHGGI